MIDWSVSSTPFESFRIRKVAGMKDKRDDSAGSLWAMMIAISDAAANHQQTCELVCHSLTSDDDDNLLTFTTGKEYWTAKVMKRLDVMALIFVARSLSGGGGFGRAIVTCNARVVAKINGILRIGYILGLGSAKTVRTCLQQPILIISSEFSIKSLRSVTVGVGC